MYKAILGRFSGGPYYLRLNRDRVAIRNLANSETVEFRAVLAIDDSRKIVSIGDPVSPDAAKVVNPFDHPRVLIHDFMVAEKLCAYAFEQSANMSPFRPAPVVVMHPDLELDGGLASMESRMLYELAEGAGARKAFVHYGAPLTDGQIHQIVDGSTEKGY